MYDPQEMIECLGEVQDGWCTRCHEKCPGVADGGECLWSHTPEECQRIRITIEWAKKLASIADGADDGWGVFADFLSAYRKDIGDAQRERERIIAEVERQKAVLLSRPEEDVYAEAGVWAQAMLLTFLRAEVVVQPMALPRYRVFGVNPTPGAQASESLINAYPTHWAAIQAAVDHPQAKSVIDWDTKEVIWYRSAPSPARLPGDANG